MKKFCSNIKTLAALLVAGAVMTACSNNDNGYIEPVPNPVLTNLADITADYTVQDGETLTGELGTNVKISIANGATVKFRDVTVNLSKGAQYAGITCNGDATIILEGNNEVKGGTDTLYVEGENYALYPGIFVPADYTLTIDGTGTLTASCYENASFFNAAGIGGMHGSDCGNIKILGGTIFATGNEGAAIGSARFQASGDISILGGSVTCVSNAEGVVGRPDSGTKCSSITIGTGITTLIMKRESPAAFVKHFLFADSVTIGSIQVDSQDDPFLLCKASNTPNILTEFPTSEISNSNQIWRISTVVEP